jgi:photosystem II stability/assembly factor-like uncharacterized protein
MTWRRLLLSGVLLIIGLHSCKKDQLALTQVTRLPYQNAATRFNKICFINDKIGFVAGGERFQDAALLRTVDGGQTFSQIHIPAAGKAIYDVTIAPDGTLYAIGFDGKLLRSFDSGSSWLFTQTDYYAYTGIQFLSANTGIVVGGISFRDGRIMYIDSLGSIRNTKLFSWQLNRVYMTSATTGYICGFGVVMQTVDGGAEWTLQKVSGDNFRAMHILGSKMWLCGDNGSIFYSSDAGNNWARLRNGNDVTLPRYRLTSIFFRDAMVGWATGENGLLIKTDDGGKHWMEYRPFTQNALRAIYLNADGTLLVAGDGGELYRISE